MQEVLASVTGQVIIEVSWTEGGKIATEVRIQGKSVAVDEKIAITLVAWAARVSLEDYLGAEGEEVPELSIV